MLPLSFPSVIFRMALFFSLFTKLLCLSMMSNSKDFCRASKRLWTWEAHNRHRDLSFCSILDKKRYRDTRLQTVKKVNLFALFVMFYQNSIRTYNNKRIIWQLKTHLMAFFCHNMVESEGCVWYPIGIISSLLNLNINTGKPNNWAEHSTYI